MTSHVFNYSALTLDSLILNLLNKGINFVPSCSKIESFKIDSALNRFIRTIKLKDFFRNNEQFKTKFRTPSNWEPDWALLSKDTRSLIGIIHNAFYNVMNKFAIHDNSSPTCNFYKTLNMPNLDNYRIIKELANNEKITIRKADKGASFVILDTLEYLNEVYHQLGNSKFYKKLASPLHPENNRYLNKLVKTALERGTITNKVHQFLSRHDEYNTRRFYILPKIHKPKNKWSNPRCPPGRPIISDVNTESSRIAEFIDFYVNKHSTELPSYVRDSFDFVEKIKHIKLDENDLLITGDVNSLYTNMNLNRTVAVIRRLFKKVPEIGRPDNLIIELLDFTLKHNDFEFNNEFFLQTCGCAMGKKYSPGLANLYLETLDKFIINYKIKPKIYLRYLDDIFLIMNKSPNLDIQAFEVEINSIIPDIKVDLNSNELSIDFLDVTVFKEDDYSVGTKVFFKETNNRLLLNPTSCHPKHTFGGIVKSQFIRYKRLSSKKEYFLKTSNELIKLQKPLGYSVHKMRAILRQIANSEDAVNIRKMENKTAILPFIIPFSNSTKLAVREVQKILSEDNYFSQFKTVAAFTKERNLLSRLF